MGWGWGVRQSQLVVQKEKRGENGKKGRVRAVGEKKVKRCFASFNQQQPTKRYQER